MNFIYYKFINNFYNSNKIFFLQIYIEKTLTHNFSINLFYILYHNVFLHIFFVHISIYIS